jgi:hypothetical protein
MRELCWLGRNRQLGYHMRRPGVTCIIRRGLDNHKLSMEGRKQFSTMSIPVPKKEDSNGAIPA